MYTGAADVMFYVKDLARSARFYVEDLGLTEAAFWSDEEHRYVPAIEQVATPCYAKFKAGGFTVALHQTDDEIRAGGLFLHLGVDDVDALYARVKSRGLAADPPEDFPWGWRMFFLTDPDGHRLGLFAENR